MLSISALYNAEDADATALLADLQSQQQGGIEKRNHLERVEKNKAEYGIWMTVLFSEGRDSCVCREQVDRPVLVLPLLSLRIVSYCQGFTG